MVSDCDSETFQITAPVDKSQTLLNSDVSNTQLVDQSKTQTKNLDPKKSSREGSKIFVPNWNNSKDSEGSKTFQVYSDQSSRTMLNSAEKLNKQISTEFSSSE